MEATEDFLRKKEEINVLLLGPYGKCRSELLQIRDYLRSKEFLRACIIEELPEIEGIPRTPADVYFLRKSEHYIREWGSILIFHLTTKCNCNSVLKELSYLVDKVPKKCIFSTIVREENYDFGTLFSGDIKIRRISEYSYANMPELLEFAFTACFYSFDDIQRLLS